MTNPFKMDPFACVWEAFHSLYPGKRCECRLAAPEDTGHEPRGGMTVWVDGEEGCAIIVLVNPNLSVWGAVKVLAHELAHVAVGPGAEHGEAWESAFEAIRQEYHRLADICLKERDGV